MRDLIYRQSVIDAMAELQGRASTKAELKGISKAWKRIKQLPSAQPEPCEDADKLKRCRFEYINACKTVTYPTPDTSKNDIYDANAVIKALYPIFGNEDF